MLHKHNALGRKSVRYQLSFNSVLTSYVKFIQKDVAVFQKFLSICNILLTISFLLMIVAVGWLLSSVVYVYLN
jgi:hypothetical protein